MQPAVTAALTNALLVEWARSGYSALRLEAVARRAGVGKAALYRRWPSKTPMVLDCLAAIALGTTAWPDTGSLEGDVTALLADFQRLLRRPVVRRILADLHAELGRSRDLAIGFEPIQRARRSAGGEILKNAIARGELRPAIDREVAIDLIAAPIYWRMVVSHGATDGEYLSLLASATLAALHSL